MRTAALGALFVPICAAAGNYSASTVLADGIEVVQLSDAAHLTRVSIARSLGNIVYELSVGGKNLLWFPDASLAEWKAKPVPCGIPFLAPWVNRLDEDAFWANGRKYLLNVGLGNLRRDANGYAIHGNLYFSPAWKLVSAEADERSARAVSRLEFWRDPDLMAQFPFAHTVTMTHRLSDGVLEIATVIENHSSSAMPVSVGFHPFLKLHDSPRAEWSVHLPARKRVVLNDRMLPTGEVERAPFTDPQLLDGLRLDDILTDLNRNEDGRAIFSVCRKREKITVAFGPKYTAGVVFTPPDKEAVCLEPIAAITNAFNLAQRGLYQALQSIPPGGRWKESFWITAEGF